MNYYYYYYFLLIELFIVDILTYSNFDMHEHLAHLNVQLTWSFPNNNFCLFRGWRFNMFDIPLIRQVKRREVQARNAIKKIRGRLLWLGNL
jgi:hypothetical protein